MFAAAFETVGKVCKSRMIEDNAHKSRVSTLNEVGELIPEPVSHFDWLHESKLGVV